MIRPPHSPYREIKAIDRIPSEDFGYLMVLK